MTYAEKLNDPRWKEKRLHIIERDEYRCRWCQSESNLEVHHSIYFNLDPWEYRDESLITLCSVCHSETERLLHEIRCYLSFIQIESIWDLDKIMVMLKRFLQDKNKFDYNAINHLINEKR